MRRLKRSAISTAVLVIAFAVGDSVFDASPQASTDRKVQRALDQSRIEEIKRHDLNLNNLRSAYINDAPVAPEFDRSIVGDAQRTSPTYAVSSATPPPPSPGIAIGVSSYDFQANASAGYQTARIAGADIVHFIWMSWDRIPCSGGPEKSTLCGPDRYVSYNSYTLSTNTLNQGTTGTYVGLNNLARAGYANGDVFENNTFQATFHQRGDPAGPYGPWHLDFPTPGNAAHSSEQLGGYGPAGCAGVLWPRIATSREGDRTIHTLAHSDVNDCPNDLLWYWRHNGTAWTGPVVIDSTANLAYVLADDPTGDKLAVAVDVSNYASMNGINNVAYLESLTDGAGWIAGTEAITKHVITNYNSDDGPGAWLHISTAYDHSGVLHIVWDEQQDANDNAETAIRHWNSQRQTVRTVALGYYDTPFLTGAGNLNLAKITLGIGDGSTLCQGGAESNEDYLYVLYTQFGGPSAAEQADRSVEDRYNGELYLTASTTGGSTWSTPVNLTNTKTPKCNPGPANESTGLPPRPDSVCRSEHWATIGMAVSDIDIFFISDLDAGGIPQGEGTWQLNPVHYLRIPGGTTNAQHLCPLLAPNFESTLTSDPDCEYHTGQSGMVQETLTIQNLGNSALSGTISVTDFPGMPMLTVSGSSSSSILAGDPDDIRTVTMTANGAPEGLYHGEISITHNDPSETSPRQFPIDLFIFNNFYCPQFASLKTGVASPGSLQLTISNDGRFGNGDPMQGMWRHKDSSSSLNAGTLLIAHGAQGPDTTVFLRYGTRASNGQSGFRALGDLVIDTAAYSTGSGCANATAKFVTADSVVEMKVDWTFRQPPDRDEFIEERIKIYRHNSLVPITNLAFGMLADLNIIPAKRLGNLHRGAINYPGSDGTRNLVWVRGVDTLGHVPVGQNTATRFRAGVDFEANAKGIMVGNAVSDLQPGGGPTDGFLYSSLQNLAGIDLYSSADTDLYVIASIDRGRSIAAGETLIYNFAFVSDTVSEASLKATSDTYSQTSHFGLCFYDGCPCWADPQCDGLRSNVQDVVLTIDVAFRGTPGVVDYGCPTYRTDVNFDNVTSVVDVARVVNVAFRGQTVAANYVNPFGP